MSEIIMSQSHDVFQKRVDILSEKHRAMANGYTASVRDDGLIVVEPKTTRRGIPFRLAFYVMCAFILFKAMIVVAMGEGTYTASIEQLADGTTAESVAAWMMQADTVTRAVASAISSVLP